MPEQNGSFIVTDRDDVGQAVQHELHIVAAGATVSRFTQPLLPG